MSNPIRDEIEKLDTIITDRVCFLVHRADVFAILDRYEVVVEGMFRIHAVDGMVRVDVGKDYLFDLLRTGDHIIILRKEEEK